MSSHQYVAVSLLWQSKHAAAASRLVRALSHVGSWWVDGLSTRYGTNWMRAKSATNPMAAYKRKRFMGVIVVAEPTTHQCQRSCTRRSPGELCTRGTFVAGIESGWGAARPVRRQLPSLAASAHVDQGLWSRYERAAMALRKESFGPTASSPLHVG